MFAVYFVFEQLYMPMTGVIADLISGTTIKWTSKFVRDKLE